MLSLIAELSFWNKNSQIKRANSTVVVKLRNDNEGDLSQMPYIVVKMWGQCTRNVKVSTHNPKGHTDKGAFVFSKKKLFQSFLQKNVCINVENQPWF